MLGGSKRGRRRGIKVMKCIFSMENEFPKRGRPGKENVGHALFHGWANGTIEG